MRLQNFGILAIIAVATTAFWVAFNQPREEAGWNGRITGISYSPYRTGQNPNGGPHPMPEQIDEDLKILSEKVDRVRVYTTQDGQKRRPRPRPEVRHDSDAGRLGRQPQGAQRARGARRRAAGPHPPQRRPGDRPATKRCCAPN
jgi:hypothetical protein